MTPASELHNNLLFGGDNSHQKIANIADIEDCEVLDEDEEHSCYNNYTNINIGKPSRRLTDQRSTSIDQINQNDIDDDAQNEEVNGSSYVMNHTNINNNDD